MFIFTFFRRFPRLVHFSHQKSELADRGKKVLSISILSLKNNMNCNQHKLSDFLLHPIHDTNYLKYPKTSKVELIFCCCCILMNEFNNSSATVSMCVFLNLGKFGINWLIKQLFEVGAFYYLCSFSTLFVNLCIHRRGFYCAVNYWVEWSSPFLPCFAIFKNDIATDLS